MTPAPDRVILVSGAHPDSAALPEAGGVQVLSVDGVSEEGLLVRTPQTRVLRPGTSAIVALLATSADDLERLEKLRGELLARGYGDMPPARLLAGGTGIGGVFAAALDIAMDLAGERAALAADEIRKLAALRRDYEDLQRAMDGAEAVLRSHELTPFRLAFAASPTSMASGPNTGAHTIEHVLPLSSEGFAAFALHFPEGSSAGRRNLILRSVEDDCELMRRQIAEEAQGWTMFALPRSPMGLPRSLCLIIEIEDGALPPSLAAPHPIASYNAQRLRGGHLEALGAPLALKIWTALPGFEAPPHLATRPEIAVAPRPIAEGALMRAVPVSLAGAARPELHVAGDAIHITAPQGKPAGGALIDVLQAGTCMVTVDVEAPVGSARTSFALAAGEVLADAVAALSGRGTGPHSGWTAVAPSGTARLCLRIDGTGLPQTLAFGVQSAASEAAPPAVFRNFQVWL